MDSFLAWKTNVNNKGICNCRGRGFDNAPTFLSRGGNESGKGGGGLCQGHRLPVCYHRVHLDLNENVAEASASVTVSDM